jgi:uncharacterized membrane protein
VQLMIIDVPSRERGLEVLDRVEAAVDEERYSVRDKALVYRADDGRTRVRQTRDVPFARVAARGGGLGALLGLLAVPAPANAAAEAAVVADAAIDDRMITRIASHIEEAKAAVVLLGDDAAIDFLSGTVDLADHDIEYIAVARDEHVEDAAGFTRYG